MSTQNNNGSKSVFLDTGGRRGKYFSYVSISLAIFVTVFLAFFIVSVLINPFLPQIKLKPVATLPQESDILPHSPERPATKKEAVIRQIGEPAIREKERRE